MPHAVAVPPAGFQALILCGPGASLNTFTSTPDEFPKALVPIANRPMVWYPLEWCYRMGITSKFTRSLLAVNLFFQVYIAVLSSPVLPTEKVLSL